MRVQVDVNHGRCCGRACDSRASGCGRGWREAVHVLRRLARSFANVDDMVLSSGYSQGCGEDPATSSRTWREAVQMRQAGANPETELGQPCESRHLGSQQQVAIVLHNFAARLAHMSQHESRI